MTQQVDLETLKMMMALLKPEPVAPVAPVAPLAPVSTHDDALMGADINRIKEDIKEIKDTLKEIGKNYVTNDDYNSRNASTDKIHGDHETRIRNLETSTTRILVWGSVIIILSTLAQVAMKFMGH